MSISEGKTSGFMISGGVRGEGCIRISCASPRRMLARWFSLSRKIKGKTAMAESRRGEDHVAEIGCLESCRRGGDHPDSALESGDSGLRGRDALFTVGVGCCLLSLISASREELQKIVELRSEIEKFLEKAEEELQRKRREFLHEPPEESEIYAHSSTTDVFDGSQSSTRLLSPQIPATSKTVEPDASQKHHASKQEVFEGGMDQLEAELEAELELLQLHLQPEGKHCTHPPQEKLRDAVRDNGTIKSGKSSSGDIITTETREEHGICPYELGRRLHELQETRQEEQIRELEAALQLAKHKLQEKETEVCWWKHTASIVLERIPESSRISFNLKRISRTHPLSR